MKYIGVSLVVIALISMLSACIDGRQGNYYQSYVNPVSNPDLIALQEGQKPQLIKSQDIEIDEANYIEMGFVVIGKSEFKTTDAKRYLRRNVSREGRKALAHAKKVSATHVLFLHERIDEFMRTTRKGDKYETEHFESFQNVAVYMTRKLSH